MWSIIVLVITILSSIWVWLDAKNIGIKKTEEKSFTNLSPVGWFLCSLLLWIIAFPLYLFTRAKFLKAKEGPKSSHTIITITGLLLVAIQVVLITMIFTGDIKMSTADLQANVLQSIKETFAKDENLKDVQIQNFNLIHKSGNEYSGVLEASQSGNSMKLVIDVTYDGKHFMWKVVQ